MERYVENGTLRIQWRDFAYLGQESVKAAQAAREAQEQGSFREYHDALYPVQPKLSREVMLEVGRDLGLDAEQMAAAMDSGEHRDRIARDVASAEASGATGTPTFFVNGKRFFGAYDASSLVEALEA